MDHTYQTCVDACVKCAIACDYCASACLNEEDVNIIARCIQLDLECATMCRTAVQLMSLRSEHASTVCQLCADVCSACAEECSRHDMEHCRECAEACRVCAEECASMAAA